MLLTYKKIVRDYNAIKLDLDAHIRLADKCYEHQFTGEGVDKKFVISRLQELYDHISILISDTKAMADDLIDGDLVSQSELKLFLIKISEIKNTAAMTLNVLVRQPTQSLYFTDFAGYNIDRFDFT